MAANILYSIYSYTLSDTLLIYKKKSELKINSQFIESFNTKNSWKEFEIVENPNSIWFEEGTYQGGTNREVESINIFNEEENRVAIFKRSTGEFITFCEPNRIEREDLMETGNFGGQSGWFRGQAKNLPPEQNVAEEMTPIDSFESQVMGMSPASEFSSIDEGQNSGFTPLTSFESDVMGIIPLDSSSSNYQI